jgi:DNA-binding transcriptional ArsR family regulator
MADLWEVIGDPHRRQLVQLLAEGEKSVSALATHFPVSRSAISQHLLLLVDVGLVTARKDGRNRYYRLHEDGVARLQKMFDAFWGKELDLLVIEAHRVRDNKGEI